MNDYYDYLDKKAASNSPDRRALPKLKNPRQPLRPTELKVPMAVEESTATDTIIERVKAFWRK
jgi:hypothetical protein